MITVVSPRGYLSPTNQTAMANRLDSLDGKTVYIVDVRWPYTHQFSEELFHELSERFPKTNFMLRDKTGAYGEDDPRLWAEIQEKGDAMIMAMGH